MDLRLGLKEVREVRDLVLGSGTMSSNENDRSAVSDQDGL